ncbi:50S ribosomal protein L35 [Patescibacteria group bacterium]
MKLKTRKSVSKRFKITKNDKVLHRTAGQDHFNSRETGKTVKNKRRSKKLSSSYCRIVKSSLL